MTSSTKTSIITTLLVLLFATLAQAADNSVWELRLKDGKPTNCQLAFTRVGQDEKDQLYLEADSRGDNNWWHSCITLPKGLLKAGEDYVVALDYEIIEGTEAANAYFYMCAHSGHLGYGADKWQRWRGETDAKGVAKLRISATVDDLVIIVGICNRGAIRIQNLKVLHGSGWTTVPLESASGNAQPPAPPTGAQPLTVDPPSNPNGPILNLADFGSVPDGDSPPSSGPDQNHAAFVAAIAKCREVKASKLIVPKGIYRITSGKTITFEGLDDFTFDGGGSTFLFDKIKGGAGIGINHCNRTVFSNFNLDWDWKVDPLASVGRVTAIAPNSSFFEMRFETTVPLDPKRWLTMNPLDEKLPAPGTGEEFSGFAPKRIDSIDPQTVRVWPSYPMTPIVGQLYLLRHYDFQKHGIVMFSNTHLSFQDVAIYSFPGIGFVIGGDQHHFELLHCRITYPENEHRSVTATGGGLWVGQSQGLIKLEDCDFGYTGDDCVDIHDNIQAGVRRLDDHTLVAEKIVPWMCPFTAGDAVEIRNGDFSPTGFTGKLQAATPNYKNNETTLVFNQELPSHIAFDAILFNLRYGSRNCIIRNCYFHENRAHAILCQTADWLIEGNRFFHNQYPAIAVQADTGRWCVGFGARNVIIRDNKFESANPSGGAVVYVSVDINGSPSRYPLLENILFENNVFQEMTGPAIEAASFKNLVISNNTFINREKAPIAVKMRGSIRAELGSGLWVGGNEWTTQKGLASPSLFYDADTTQKIVCKSNLLKN